MIIISQSSFYHGTKKIFPIGFILLPQLDGYVHQEIEIENILEKYRPENKISRFNSVFLVDNPDNVDFAGGYEDYIYKVQPIGQIDKSDLSWYSDVSIYNTEKENQIYATNYWNQIPYKNSDNSLWEYRCKSAKIIELIST